MARPIARLEIPAPGGPARLVPIDRLPFSIGSDRSANLPLEGPGLRPHHAQIVYVGGAYHLLPDTSVAALSVDGAPVTGDGIRLATGSQIDLGPGCPGGLRFVLEPPRHDREDRLVMLMEIARTITSSLTLDDVLDRVIDGAVRFSGAERGYLFLREGDLLVPRMGGSEDPGNVEVSRSVAEEVARTGRPVYRDRLNDETGGAVTDSIVRLRLQAILCLPLAVRQDVIGVVYLDSQRPLPHHGPDRPLLEALAGLAAIAIQNSRLVEERVRAERTLAIGQMARAIVHDLRSPLASIRALADLLLGRANESDPARPHLATIIAEVDRLTGLTGDLLQFSKDSPPPLRSPAKLADLVRQAVHPLGARLQQAGVRLTLGLSEDARASVDGARILRLLHNLVANALEAMRQGGTLDIRCERSDGGCLLAVSDSGSGMTEEVRRRVFEPFFSHGKPNGTGLGLAIVRKIVEEHGGAIGVDSIPGRGTTVSVRLPASP